MDIELPKSEARNIKLAMIRKPDVLLRDVKRQTADFEQLKDSIRKKGVINSIAVRETRNQETGAEEYVLVDGLQRYTACSDLGFETIPANVVNMNDGEVLEAQIIANVKKIATHPVAIGKQILRILGRDPSRTIDSMAEALSVGTDWIKDRIRLNNLDPDVQAKVDANQIPLANAIQLSKLEPGQQREELQAAMDEEPKIFVPRVKELIRAMKDAHKTGEDADTSWKPTQRARKFNEIKQYAETPDALLKNIEAEGASTPVDIVRATLNWVLSWDKLSQQAQQAEHEKRVQERETAKAAAKKEREEKKQKVASEALDLTF